MDLPRWVQTAAAQKIAFAQVREDPLIDLEVLKLLKVPQASCMMIASGGCNAAFLAASGRLSHLHLVDFNPDQMARCGLKLFKVEMNETPASRLRQMGHYPIDEMRQTPMLNFQHGWNRPDHRGRYELLFMALRNKLSKCMDDLTSVLMMDDPAARSSRVAPHTPLGRILDDAFDEIMSLENLVCLFGEKATQNSRQPFSRHFAERTRHAIANMPTRNNPYLWQMLLGRFPTGTVYPWFTAIRQKNWPKISETVGTIDSALALQQDAFDFIHLSNVLDWLSPDEAKNTLQLAFRALRRNGLVIIRQLNSMLEVPAMGDQFEWLTEQANHLHAQDRSFFYRSLHLGRKG